MLKIWHIIVQQVIFNLYIARIYLSLMIYNIMRVIYINYSDNNRGSIIRGIKSLVWMRWCNNLSIYWYDNGVLEQIMSLHFRILVGNGRLLFIYNRYYYLSIGITDWVKNKKKNKTLCRYKYIMQDKNCVWDNIVISCCVNSQQHYQPI